MTYYKPLTPEFRDKINNTIKSINEELDTCDNTPYVVVQRIGLQALGNLINAFPDGYPIPVERSTNEKD